MMLKQPFSHKVRLVKSAFFCLVFLTLFLGSLRAESRFSGVVTILAGQVEADYLFYYPRLPKSIGSGILIDKEGYVLAPASLVMRANWVEVILPNLQQEKASIVGIDHLTELALLKIKRTGQASPVKLSRKRPFIGEEVFLVTRPRGKIALKTGCLVQDDRLIVHRGLGLGGFLTADLSLQGLGPGPVFNHSYEVIGFALNLPDFKVDEGLVLVPTFFIKRVYQMLKEKQQAQWPWLGVKLLPLTKSLAHTLRLPISKGVLVVEVYPGSPASRVGLRGSNKKISVGNILFPVGGDIIVRIDGREVSSPGEVDRIVFSKRPGDNVQILYYRNKRPRRTNLRLGRRIFVQP